tara:strand:- start:246 stop:623 length:378 start_codon:yes stop_codon:yes gene_type:complete
LSVQAAVVHSFDGTWYVMDLGSRFGTLLNGTKLEAKKYVPLEEGALIRLGAHLLTRARLSMARLTMAHTGCQHLGLSLTLGRARSRRVHALLHLQPDGAGASAAANHRARKRKAAGGAAATAASA